MSLDDLRNETEMKTGISAFIITKNEAHKLAQCLESVAFCDEIIILDSGSTDGTVELAKQYGCKVTLTTDWPGFGIQKQRALDLTSHDWVLSVDSDEVISLGLQDTIKKIMAKFSSGGFWVTEFEERICFLGKNFNMVDGVMMKYFVLRGGQVAASAPIECMNNSWWMASLVSLMIQLFIMQESHFKMFLKNKCDMC